MMIYFLFQCSLPVSFFIIFENAKNKKGNILSIWFVIKWNTFT